MLVSYSYFKMDKSLQGDSILEFHSLAPHSSFMSRGTKMPKLSLNLLKSHSIKIL